MMYTLMYWLVSPYVFLFFILMFGVPPSSPLFPYTTLFRSVWDLPPWWLGRGRYDWVWLVAGRYVWLPRLGRSEEHTSELQSLRHLVCRLLLEKKKNNSRRASGITHRTPITNSISNRNARLH